MLEINIPGFGNVHLKYAVFDYNGTLARDGKIDPQVKSLLIELNQRLDVHIITADTFGRVKSELRDAGFQIHILSGEQEAVQKSLYVQELDADSVVSFGNGNNDVQMLKISRFGISVIMEEGASIGALNAADLVVRNIQEGIDLLLNPLRIKATLRF